MSGERRKLTENQKKVLKELVDNKCQKCGSKERLEIHRIKRGHMGGLYVPNNILVICRKCHIKIHANELGCF